MVTLNANDMIITATPIFAVYIDLSGPNEILELNFALSGTGARRWNIKSSQLDCTLAPPECCFQYHTGTSGMIFSFNWQNEMVPLHLVAQDYSICIRQEKGDCKH